jgi:CRP/FNR family cyclic AMP-dependent transcriptional regulator
MTDGLSSSSVTSVVPSALTLDSLLLDVLQLLLRDPADSPGPHLTEHTQCSVLSASLRGKLCTKLERGPGRLLQAGEHVYRVGTAAQSVFLVQSGVVKTSVFSPRGDELTLRIHGAGEVLGELCLCEGVRREQATALEASRVVEMPLPTLLAELQRDAEAALELATSVCQRLGEAYSRVRSLGVDPLMQRLVQVLLKSAAESGETSPAGTRIGSWMTQEELAKLVGASREAISRRLNRLRESGLISYTPRGAITVHTSALQSFLQSLTRE